VNNKQHYMPGVVISGLVAGLIGAASDFLGCCTCWCGLLGAMGFGVLAVKLVRDKSGGGIEMGEGAAIGAIQGVMAGAISGIAWAIITLLMQEQNQQMMREMGFDVPMQSSGVMAAIIPVCASVLIYPMMGALGGLIACAIWKDEPGGGPQPPQTGGGFGGPGAGGQGGFGGPPQGGAPGGGFGGPPQGGAPPAGGGFGGPPQGGAPPAGGGFGGPPGGGTPPPGGGTPPPGGGFGGPPPGGGFGQ